MENLYTESDSCYSVGINRKGVIPWIIGKYIGKR